jgi:hypothetical protein
MNVLARGLRQVAMMARRFNALTQLADRDRRKEQRDALCGRIPKESSNTRVRVSALSRVADDVGGQRAALGRNNACSRISRS